MYKPKNIVGHSLGSGIGKIIIQDLGNTINGRLYGSPVIDATDYETANNYVKYYSHNLDPVSSLNFGATNRTPYLGLNPHSYDGF